MNPAPAYALGGIKTPANTAGLTYGGGSEKPSGSTRRERRHPPPNDPVHVAERWAAYNRLMNDGALKCPGGYLAYHFGRVYFVTETGRVYRLCYKKFATEREAILRALKGNIPSKRLVETRDIKELQNVARQVGKICPWLVPIILP